MLRSEFEKLTGFYPPENLFAVIEEYYTQSELNVEDFCIQYRFNMNGIAEKIQNETNSRLCREAFQAGAMLGETKLENEKAIVKTLAAILKRAGEISPEDFKAIVKQCEIQI